jgi:methylated-DNA-[protein]-cysteine S-methyltransferase
MTTTFPTPIGPLTLHARADALTGVWMEDDPDLEGLGEDAESLAAPLTEARRQLEAYFAGELREFDLPLAPEGTDFQLRVWEQLRAIPYGETISYGELARRVGDPGAARAVGLANGRNPLPVIVPCHRVIGADGSLTGFGGGLDRKRRLLELEAGVATLPAA